MSPVSNKRAKFILALYGVRAKEKKSLTTKVSRLVTRIRSNATDDAANDGRRVESLISASFSFTESGRPLSLEVIQDLRHCIESYIMEIYRIISDGDGLGKAWEISMGTAAFFKEWNGRVNELDGQFLEIYRDVFSQDILLSNKIFVDTIAVLKKCRKVPQPLRFLLEETVGDAINSSLEMTTVFQTLKKNANS